MRGLARFFSDWASLIIALVALAQPWVISLFRRMFRPGMVEVVETGNVEITFGTFGAMISAQGTLLSQNHDVFIQSIVARIERLADGSQHEFDWVAFRPYEVRLGEEEPRYEMPAAFMVQVPEPRRFHITFQDTQPSADVLRVLKPLRAAWDEVWNEESWPILASAGGTPIEEIQKQFQGLRDKLHMEFIMRPDYSSASDEVEQL